MANDIQKMKPSACCRTLNSTPLGTVINERQLYRYRTEAGIRIGDGTHVDLLKFTAWLIEKRHSPKPPVDDDPYAKVKEKARARNAAVALAGRDIGDLPTIEDPERKAKAAGSFRFFCEAYFKLTFHLDWSPDHLKVMDKIEEAVVRGGLFSLAMARGSGKSSLAEVACIWAVLNGYRDFVCLIGSDEGHACDMLDSIKTELDANERLLADYPEVCFPIQSLDGIANRANGQLYQGKRTQIGWTAKEIVLPTITGSKASGAIIKVAGLTGRIRGMKFKRPDGKTVRPSLVVLDDPQTDESARSLSQCANREAILAGAVLGLAGPGKKISGIMPCTVIRPGDMADNILDRDKHPEWNGARTRMVNSFPTNETLWERYAEIRSEGLRAGDGGAAGTEFYRENRSAMDEGSDVAWKERFNHDELSAIQHAMNLKLQDEAAFFAEYQNEPLPAETVDADQLTTEQVASKYNNMPRRSVPISGNHLTAFIDIQGKLLFYVVAAWEDDFTGYVVDYGSYPDQQRPYFTLRDARHTLATEGTGLEGSIYAGLGSLTEDLLGREWSRDDGAAMKIGRCLIDANWGHSTNVVYQFCRQSPHASILLPSHGRFVGASSNPFSEYKRRPGDRVGLNWRIPSINGKRAIRHIIYDTNWWKSFTHARLAVAMGDHGCLSIFGDRPEPHRMFAEQVTAEYFVKTEGRGRTVDEWKARPEQPDNHWLDCLVGTAVAASMQGALLFGTDVPSSPKRGRVSFKELQRKKKN